MKARGRPTNMSREADGEGKSRLVDATIELMIEKGSIDVSFADIARRTELNSALIGYYFGSKGGLMLAVLRKVMGEGIDELEKSCRESQTLEESLLLHIRGLVATYFKFPFVNPLVHRLVIDQPDEYGPVIAEELSRRVALIQDRMLKQGKDSGRLRPVDPLHFYFHIVGACDQFFHGRFQMRHLFGRDEIDERMAADYAEYLSNTILHGMLRAEQEV
jgi:TetR/AcrR family transcriptional regulator